MALNPVLVTLGTISGGATSIQADISGGLSPATPVYVTLSTGYTLASPRPPGFPVKPAYTGVAQASFLDYPGAVIPSGTRLALLAPEAAALVGAGAGSYS